MFNIPHLLSRLILLRGFRPEWTWVARATLYTLMYDAKFSCILWDAWMRSTAQQGARPEALQYFDVVTPLYSVERVPMVSAVQTARFHKPIQPKTFSTDHGLYSISPTTKRLVP